MTESTFNFLQPEMGVPIKAWTKGVPLASGEDKGYFASRGFESRHSSALCSSEDRAALLSTVPRRCNSPSGLKPAGFRALAARLKAVPFPRPKRSTPGCQKANGWKLRAKSKEPGAKSQ